MTVPTSTAGAQILDLLTARGFRLTGPRRAVLATVVAAARPMTAAEIHERLGDRRINLVSVYRAVHLLCDLGALRVAGTSRGTQRFEMGEAFTGHHHHLVCRRCGRIEDFEGCLLGRDALSSLSRRARRLKKFRVVEHDLRLYGLCGRCDIPPASGST